MGIQTDSNVLCNGVSDLILQRQCIAEITLVLIGPQVLVFRGLNQLRRDANPVAGAEHSPFHDRVHVQLARDLRQGLACAFVCHH